MELDRPTLILIAPEGEPIDLTVAMESELMQRMAWIEDVRAWEDWGGNRFSKRTSLL